MITAHGSEKAAVQAMKLGATDYLPKPFDNDELRVVVRRAMEAALLRRDHRRLLEQVQGAYGFEQIIGSTPPMRRVFETIERVADTDVTVLIRGESGTGKELVANALHYRGPRRAKPFVKMNCAALCRASWSRASCSGTRRVRSPAPWRGARASSRPRDGGTLFLDECGDMPLETQAKLLRALQEKEIERVGGNQPITRRRAGDRRHQPGSRGGSAQRPLSRGSLLPPARRRDRRFHRWPSVAKTSRCWSTAFCVTRRHASDGP